MDVLNGIFIVPLDVLPFLFLAALLSFTVHEFAHAVTAYRFGDPTAKREGRVSLNPRVHVDLLGMLLILLAGFGWAKPVPVNPRYFKHPRLMSIVVSFAGPLSNLLFAFFAVLLGHILLQGGLFAAMGAGVKSAVNLFLILMIQLNIVLFLFNLIPLPPLDGYRIVENLVPPRVRERMARMEPWAVYIFLLLVFIKPLYRVTIGPIMALSDVIFAAMDAFVSRLFG